MGLRELDDVARHYRRNLGFANAAMHDRLAAPTDCAKISAPRSHQGELDHAQCWCARLPTAEAIHCPRLARAFPTSLAVGEECPHCSPLEQNRAIIVDRLEPLSLPVTNSVFVHVEATREFIDGIAAVQLYPVWIRPPTGHDPFSPAR